MHACFHVLASVSIQSRQHIIVAATVPEDKMRLFIISLICGGHLSEVSSWFILYRTLVRGQFLVYPLQDTC